MKSIKLLLMLLLVSNTLFSQKSLDKEDYTIIYFKDGSSVKGKNLERTSSTFNPSGQVRFNDNRKTKKIKYKPENIDYIKSFHYADKTDFIKLKEEIKALPKKQKKNINIDSLLLAVDTKMKNWKERYIEKKTVFLKINGNYKYCEVLVEGKVNLYKSSGFAMAGDKQYYYEDYYITRKSNIIPYKISKNKISNKKFTKKATEYFNDCNELVKKINDGNLLSKDIKEIVEFYNNECTK